MKKNENFFYIGVIAISILAIIILGIGYLKDKTGSSSANSSDIQIEAIKPKEDKEKVTVTFDTQTLQDGLQGMGFLVTQEYYFTQIGHYKKEKQIVGPLSSTAEFSYSYDGSVTAGINFEKISISCDMDKKVIMVTMPQSEIQGVIVDRNSFKKYSEKDYLWNAINIDDYNMSLVEYEESAKKKALDNRILEKSDEQAKLLVQKFLYNFPQIAGYDITFEEGEES